ncbi:MAG TPA: amidase [Novosphingobium sp.]|nr:amidase [Novosphingobium sp.]
MTIFVETLELGSAGGLRVAVKDSIDVAGCRTRDGSRAMANVAPATTNAEVVAHVLGAGCRIIGKTVMHELAFGLSGINDWAGTPVNPGYADLIPGGSSSGSAAAVAAGLADFAIGSDTGGSIRVPAACCGIWGLKPTFGRVSRKGVAPAETSLDCVGPFARTIGMIEQAMAIIDPGFAPASVVAPRVGLVEVDADPAVTAACRGALVSAGLAMAPAHLALLEEAFAAGLVIINAETWAAFGGLVETGLLGADVEARLRAAAAVTHEQVAEAESVRAAFTAAVDRLLYDHDALALPTLAGPPPTVAAVRSSGMDLAFSRFVRPFNLSGHPALSLPVAGPAGWPVSLQLVGRKGEEAQLCAIARALA